MNLPNKLTILRVIMIPFFVFFLLSGVGGSASKWIALVIFAAASITDTLDGYIARRDNLITDFGKFLDPLADKFMIFGALLSILVMSPNYSGIFVWVTAIIMFRELAVTSLRLVVVGSSGKVIAANMSGKIKTVSQIAGVIFMIIEPVTLNLLAFWPDDLLSYISMAIMTFTTLWSGLSYFKGCVQYIDPTK